MVVCCGAEGHSDRLKLLWEENGGPAVAKPERRGFGSRLIERSLAAELDGTVDLAFEPTGVRCAIDVPLETADEDSQAWSSKSA
jgi:two-component sensor histidine kinase